MNEIGEVIGGIGAMVAETNSVLGSVHEPFMQSNMSCQAS